MLVTSIKTLAHIRFFLKTNLCDDVGTSPNPYPQKDPKLDPPTT